MPGKRKITIETLTELGAHKLAELLIAEAAGNRKLKQAIDLAISNKGGPAVLVANVRKRLAGFVKSRSMPSYERGREIIVELDGLRTMIVDTIGFENPRLAFELLWELIELHPSILELIDDSSGHVGDVFTTACYDLGPLAERASVDPDALAALVFQKITNNPYGIYDGLIRNLDAALGQEGRAKLRGLLLQRRQQYLTNDKVAAIAAGHHDFTLSGLSLALRDIAEIESDTDAFIDTYQGRDLTNPHFASEIGLQLLRAGRAEEALSYLDRAQPSEQNRHFGQLKWTDARIAALDAVKRTDEAQALRLAFFQVHLSVSHLRAYIRRLPDFEDFEAEQRALDRVVGHANVHAALLAEVAPDHVVLEVGTGSGYQAAVLAHLARKVCTIEIIPPLAEAAAKTLRDLAYFGNFFRRRWRRPWEQDRTAFQPQEQKPEPLRAGCPSNWRRARQWRWQLSSGGRHPFFTTPCRWRLSTVQ
jgi:tetratricopeptide (TPR) repeat protein